MLVTAINKEKQKLINIGIEKTQSEIIINMYKNGMDINDIFKFTNVSLEKIKQILDLK